MILQLSQ